MSCEYPSRHTNFDKQTAYYKTYPPTRIEALEALGKIVEETTYLLYPYIIPVGVTHIGFNGEVLPVLHLRMKECPGAKCDTYTYSPDIGGLKKGKYLCAKSLAYIIVKEDMPEEVKLFSKYWYQNVSIAYAYPTMDFEWFAQKKAIKFVLAGEDIRYFVPESGKRETYYPSSPPELDSDEEQFASFAQKMRDLFSNTDFVWVDTFIETYGKAKGWDKNEIESKKIVVTDFLESIL